MLRKIRNKFKVLYKKQVLLIKTRLSKLLGMSDTSRWSQSKYLYHDWDERTSLLSRHIQPNSIVFEFGAARLSLETMLPEGCTYLHSDIVARNDKTYVCDLNAQLPMIPNVDAVVFSGVLEYIIKVPELLKHLNNSTSLILFSYATNNAYPNISVRRSHGWISDHSLGFFEELAKSCNFKQDVIGTWRNQHLFKWTKNH